MSIARPRGPAPVTANPFSLLAYMRAMRKDGEGRIARRFARYGDIYYAPFLGRDVYVLRHPDHIRQVLVERASSFEKPEAGVSARELKRLLGNGLLTSNGEAWRTQRRRIQPAFKREHLDAYGAYCVQFADEAARSLRAGAEIDVSRKMMDLTLRVVTKSLFDHEISDEADRVAEAMRAFRDSFGTMDAFLPRFVPTPTRRRTSAARRAIDDIVYGFIDARRRQPTGRADLLSLLAAPAPDGQPMAREQLRDELLTMFIAGHETTSHALSFAWAMLARNPSIEADLHREWERVLGGRLPHVADLPKLALTERVILETMRLYPPAYVIPRCASADVTIGDYAIPRGADVILWIYHLHHDPRWYPDPERFDPDRFLPEASAARPPGAYVPFGAGTRICIGKQFAMMEAQLILTTLGQQVRFRDDAAHRLRKRMAVTLAPEGLVMRVERRPEAQLAPRRAHDG